MPFKAGTTQSSKFKAECVVDGIFTFLHGNRSWTTKFVDTVTNKDLIFNINVVLY